MCARRGLWSGAFDFTVFYVFLSEFYLNRLDSYMWQGSVLGKGSTVQCSLFSSALHRACTRDRKIEQSSLGFSQFKYAPWHGVHVLCVLLWYRTRHDSPAPQLSDQKYILLPCVHGPVGVWSTSNVPGSVCVLPLFVEERIHSRSRSRFVNHRAGPCVFWNHMIQKFELAGCEMVGNVLKWNV